LVVGLPQALAYAAPLTPALSPRGRGSLR